MRQSNRCKRLSSRSQEIRHDGLADLQRPPSTTDWPRDPRVRQRRTVSTMPPVRAPAIGRMAHCGPCRSRSRPGGAAACRGHVRHLGFPDRCRSAGWLGWRGIGCLRRHRAPRSRRRQPPAGPAPACRQRLSHADKLYCDIPWPLDACRRDGPLATRLWDDVPGRLHRGGHVALHGSAPRCGSCRVRRADHLPCWPDERRCRISPDIRHRCSEP